jgi:hypothetical protein
VVVLNSFKEHRPSLLRKLLRNLAELKELTLLIDFLDEPQGGCKGARTELLRSW